MWNKVIKARQGFKRSNGRKGYWKKVFHRVLRRAVKAGKYD